MGQPLQFCCCCCCSGLEACPSQSYAKASWTGPRDRVTRWARQHSTAYNAAKWTRFSQPGPSLPKLRHGLCRVTPWACSVAHTQRPHAAVGEGNWLPRPSPRTQADRPLCQLPSPLSPISSSSSSTPGGGNSTRVLPPRGSHPEARSRAHRKAQAEQPPTGMNTK